MALKYVLCSLFLCGLLPLAANAQRCPYDQAMRNFEGTPVVQARCLLRVVEQDGQLGPVRVALPAPLETLVGQPVNFSKSQFLMYLKKIGVLEADVGGAVANPVSETSATYGVVQSARYFVIHDTSTPNYGRDPFPDNIDDDGWDYNKNLRTRWNRDGKTSAHVFVNRMGASATTLPFDTAWRATKFEMRYAELFPGEPADALKGMFLHIELVQPRRSARVDGKGDAIAPDPGFTDEQYLRLAILYAAASLRKGQWLVPAFHAALDVSIPDAHDDPQKFSLESWANAIELVRSDADLQKGV